MKTLIVLLSIFAITFTNVASARSFTPRKIGFHLGVLDPYPSPIGFGLSYFFNEFVGISGMTGIKSLSESRLSTFTAGLRFMATRQQISPVVFLGISSYENDLGARLGIGYLGVGLNLSISDNVYLGAGANFGLSSREGRHETLPYVQFGVLY